MGMDRQIGVAAEFDHADQADRIDARHYAGAAFREDQIVAPSHLVDLSGQVEGEHHLLAGPIGVTIDDLHDRPRARVARRIRDRSRWRRSRSDPNTVRCAG